MRRGKFRFLLMSLLVASGLVVTGGEVPAATFSYELTSATVSAPSPTTSATYYYVFSQNTGSTAIGYIDFEIPVEIEIGNAGALPAVGNGYIKITMNGSTGLSGEIYGTGVGDFGTKFGVGDSRYKVVKVAVPSTISPFTIELAITNQSFSGDKILGSEQGSILIKAGNGSNTLTFLTSTPAVVAKPATPPPVITSFSANPNPSLPGGSVTLSWDVPSGTTVYLNDCVATSPTTVNPSTTTSYTIVVVWEDGSSSSTATTIVQVISLPGAPSISNFSANPDSLISGQQPLCTKLSWTASADSTLEISSSSPPDAPVSVASGLGPTGNMTVCPEKTTEYTAVANNLSGESLPATATVTVNAPVIQTSCMQILKKPADGPSSCLHVCFEIGGDRGLVSADAFANDTCEGTGTPLAIFGPDVPDPALRVPALHCNPCGVTPTLPINGVLPSTLVCSGIPFQPGAIPPFDIATFDADGNAYSVRCEKIIKEYEPSGYTLDLGKDPTYWNGSRWVSYSCPPGYRDTGTKCVIQ